MKKLDQIERIYVLPYSHHDHAWTNSRQWHIWRYVEGYCLMLDRMNQDPHYTQIVDNVLHSLDAFCRYCPSRVEEFRKRVREGRISVANGGMALVRPADYDGELLIRNGCEGRRELMERLDLTDIPVYFNADTVMGASQMPQLLRLMGHRGYSFQRPECALHRMGVPNQFRWKGLDGTEILVSRGAYGSCLWSEWDKAELSWEEKREAFVKENLREKLDCQSSELIMLHVGLDDCLPGLNIYDRPYDLNGFMVQWNEHENSIMEYSTFSRLFEDLSQKTLPVWEGPLDPCELSFNAAFRVDASLRKLRLQAERLLLVCERLDAMAVAMGAVSREADLRKLWSGLFAFAGHAMQHLLSKDYEDALDRAAATLAGLRSLQAEIMDDMACRVCCGSRVAQLVVNPSLHGGKQVVTMHITTPHHIDGLVLRDASGRVLPWQMLQVLNGDKPYDRQCNEIIVAVDMEVPPMGWTTVTVECDHQKMDLTELNSDAEGAVIDNGLFRATVLGGLLCRIRTEQGNVTEGPLVQPQFCATETTGSWNYRWEPKETMRFEAKTAHLTANGPLQWTLVTEGTVGSSAVTLEQTIRAGSPVIDCRMTLDNRQGEGYFTLVLPSGASPEIVAAVPFGEEARTPETYLYHHPGEEASMLAEERGWPYAFFASGYASFRAGAGRLLLLQGDCSNLMKAAPGSCQVEQHLFRSIDMSTKTDWTRFMHETASGRGVQHFAFAVAVCPAAHDGAAAQALLQAQRAPVSACARYTVEPGTAVPHGSLFKTEGADVQLSAAYYRDQILVLRLVETGGVGGTVHLMLPEGAGEVRVTDLNGTPMEKTVERMGQSASVVLHPYEICTLQISR